MEHVESRRQTSENDELGPDSVESRRVMPENDKVAGPPGHLYSSDAGRTASRLRLARLRWTASQDRGGRRPCTIS